MRTAARLVCRVQACLVAAFLGVGSVAVVHAQGASGSIEGTVVDPSGAVLAGVTIMLRQPAFALERVVETDASGAFRAPLLPVGSYELTASLTGFETRRHTDLRLTVGQTLILAVVMRVALVETVVVSGATPILETSRGHVTSTIDQHAVQNLPVNGRNFIDFALLTPGVTRDVRSGDLSFAGQRGTLNSLIVDGADNNNTFFGQALGRTGSGRAPYQFSQEAVREFQIISNSFSAEYGRAGGGVINVVTRSGSNDVHASLFEFYRDKAMNARDPISVLNGRPKRPYHYHQFGGTAGGPIRRDRDFFFFSYDGQRNRQSNSVALNLPPNTPDDEATRAAVAALRALAFDWDQRLDQDVFLFRTDHRLGGTALLTLRYNHQNFTGEGYEQTGQQQSFEHTGDSLVKTRTLNATWSAEWRRAVFNELRFQYARDNEPGEANSDTPEAMIRQGTNLVLVIGRNNFSPRHNIIDRVQIADTVTWSRGAHGLKGGLDLQFDRIENFFPAFFSGSYRFSSLAAFHEGRPASYQQNFPRPGTSGASSTPNIREYSLFAQDDWRVRRDLTLNLGLRYDLMKTDAPPVRNPHAELAEADIDTGRLAPDTNNWGPRLGVAWRPHGQPYVLRGGAGVFYGRTPAMMVTAAHTNNGINIVSLTFPGDAVPIYPGRFHEPPASGVAALPNIVYIDKDFRNPRLLHANAAFEWEVLSDTSLTITYLFVDGTGLPRAIDRNLGSPTQRTLTIAGSGDTVQTLFFGADRRFPSFARVVAFESSAESRYQGLTLELIRRFTRDTQLRLAYTLGKVVDTAPDATAVLVGNIGADASHASNPLDFETDRTVGNNDHRHRIVASGLYATTHLASRLAGVPGHVAAGWTISAIVSAQSGLPYSARVVGDLNGDGNPFNDLAPGTRRNQFRLPAIFTVDSRIARDIPVGGRLRAQLIWEAFNLLNRDNISAILPGAFMLRPPGAILDPNPQFGLPLATTGERIMQLAVRLAF